MSQISLHRERTAAFLSAAQLTILAFALLHVRANEKDHFRIGLSLDQHACHAAVFASWSVGIVRLSGVHALIYVTVVHLQANVAALKAQRDRKAHIHETLEPAVKLNLQFQKNVSLRPPGHIL